jgi:hypothetical protein
MSPETMARALKHGFETAHGVEHVLPSVVNVLVGVYAEEASWRPEPGSRTIWQIVAHVNGWIELLIADLAGLPKERIQDWPKVRAETEEEWVAETERLRSNVDTLSQLVFGLSSDELCEVRPKHRSTRLAEVFYAMALCAFNAGRIVKLRTLYEHHKPVVSI